MIDNGCADGTHLRTGAVVLAVSRKPAVATQGAAGHLLVRHTRPVCMHSPAMRSVLQASPPIPSRSEITTARDGSALRPNRHSSLDRKGVSASMTFDVGIT
jgi:hypothetical protein